MRFALFLSISVLMFSCTQPESTDQNTDAPVEKQEVNVYTHRHYDVDQDIFNRFEEQTGIKVNVVKASADELIVRLENEGEKSPADLLVTVDAGRLVMAQQKGLLQPVKSELLEASIPAHLRDPEGYWFGQTVRARLLVYSKERVKPEELTSFEDLTDAQWKERILVRSSSNIYNQSLLASIIANNGEEAAEAWAGGMVANFARSPKGNDRDQVIGIAAGQGDVAIVNSYYIGKMYDSEDEGERAAVNEIGVFFPNQEGNGTHINISGAGVTTHAPNRENAVKLLEFMATPEIQKIFAEANHEYPVHPQAEVSDLLKSWGEFKQDTLNLKLLGEYNSKAVEIFDRAGWK
jgi:iron(III) transport system substrate-binding protein